MRKYTSGSGTSTTRRCNLMHICANKLHRRQLRHPGVRFRVKAKSCTTKNLIEGGWLTSSRWLKPYQAVIYGGLSHTVSGTASWLCHFCDGLLKFNSPVLRSPAGRSFSSAAKSFSSLASRRSTSVVSIARNCRFKRGARPAAILGLILPESTSVIKRATVSRTASALSSVGSGSAFSPAACRLLPPPIRPNSEALLGLA